MFADPSLNHLVRAQQQRLRDRQAERLGGFDVHRHIEFRRTLDGQIGRLDAFEDLVDVGCGAPLSALRSVPKDSRPPSVATRALEETTGNFCSMPTR